MSTTIGRRAFLGRAALGVTGAMAGPLIEYRRVFAQPSKTLVVAAGSGTYQKAQIEAFFKPFTKATGIEVEPRSYLSLAQKKAMVETKNVTADVVSHAFSDVIVMGKNGWLQPVDYAVFRPEDLDRLSATDKQQFGLGFFYWSELMAYRTDVFRDNPPKNWIDFWDTKRFPGPRSLGDPSHAYGLEFALLADGVPMDKLYPLDLDRALKSMSRIRKDVVAWWGAAAAQPAQLINDKEIVACSVANGRIIEVINAGAPVAIEWNQGMLFLNFYSILKGAKNRENANRFLTFVARPDAQAEFAKQIPYGPTNPKAYESIDPKIARTLPTYPEYRKKMFVRDDAWWAATGPSGKSNRELIVERWEAWKLQG